VVLYKASADGIRSHPFLKDLDEESVNALCACAESQSYAAGEYLWRQGEHAEALYLIDSGEVSLEIQVPNFGPLAIDLVGGGEVAGWSWQLPPYRLKFDARATGPVHVYALNAEALRTKSEADPRFGYELLRRVVPIISRRLDAARIKLFDLEPSKGVALHPLAS
jgi:CRP-like cAMP-binding protein